MSRAAHRARVLARKLMIAARKANRQPCCPRCNKHDEVQPVVSAGADLWEWMCAHELGGCGRRWVQSLLDEGGSA